MTKKTVGVQRMGRVRKEKEWTFRHIGDGTVKHQSRRKYEEQRKRRKHARGK